MKPEPPILERVIAELGVDPGDAVLIDDSAENIEAAGSGIRGLGFRTGESSPTELAAFLRRVGTNHSA